MAKFLIVIEGDDNGKASIEKDGKDTVTRLGDRLRQAGYSVESARFSRGGVQEPHSAEARAKAKLEAKAAADKKEAERVKAENEAARKTS